jgi:hypothetical protein
MESPFGMMLWDNSPADNVPSFRSLVKHLMPALAEF